MWIINIADPTRNQVNVTVKNRLPGALAVVDSDVETRDRFIRRLRVVLRLMKQLSAGVDFRLPEFKIRRDVTLRDDQFVQLGHRKAVKDEITEPVFSYNSGFIDFAE